MQKDSDAMDEIEAWRQLVGLEELQAMREETLSYIVVYYSTLSPVAVIV